MSTWWESFNLPESIKYGKEDYEYLWSIRPDKPHKVKIYGKEFDTPRLQKAYGRDYKFSGTIAHSDPVPERLNRLIEFMNDKICMYMYINTPAIVSRQNLKNDRYLQTNARQG